LQNLGGRYGLSERGGELFGDNLGLVIAEVELDDETQEVVLPAWVGEDFTGDPRYYNANLVRHPYVSGRPHTCPRSRHRV